MWRRARAALAPLDPVRVENSADPGTPDVNLADGSWIEMKWRRGWPRRDGTAVTFDHFTPQQRRWIERRVRAGGRVWVLVKVATEWLLLEGRVACRVLGQANRDQLLRAAAAVWGRGLRDEELREALLREG